MAIQTQIPDVLCLSVEGTWWNILWYVL